MRSSYYLAAGNCYGGPDYESALQLPAKGENATEVGSALLLLAIPAAVGYVAENLSEGRLHLVAVVLWPLLRWGFTVCFGIHYCSRYTLMDEESRTKALVAFFVVGLPLTFVPFSFLLPLLAWKQSWRAVVSWFSYPDDTVPGLWRRPFGSFWIRVILSAPLAIPMALVAIYPATFFTEHEDD